MGWALKYCDKCKKVYAGPSNKCAACNSDLLVSNYDSDVYATLSDPEKEIQLKKLFVDDADISPANTSDSSATWDKETGRCLCTVPTKIIPVILSINNCLGFILILYPFADPTVRIPVKFSVPTAYSDDIGIFFRMAFPVF